MRALTRSAVGLAVVCALATACSDSKYQSFRDTGMQPWIDARRHWQFTLPFKSGERLGILRIAPDDVLVFDPGKTLHVMRISRGPSGRQTIAAELDCGDAWTVLRDDLVLVTGPRDSSRRCVFLLDPKTLERRFASDLPFGSEGDITTEGSEIIANLLILHHSSVRIARIPWADGAYQYQVPYVAGAKYDLHVIDLQKGLIASLAEIDGGSLDRVGPVIAGSRDAVLAAITSRGPSTASERQLIRDHLYLFDEFFVVDNQRTLVFSLKNTAKKKVYYSFDLRRPRAAPQWHAADELAVRYPNELVSREMPDKMSGEITVSEKQYAVEHAAILTDGVVVTAREQGGIYEITHQTAPLTLLGISQDAGESWKLKWEQYLGDESGDEVLEDPSRGVYVPSSEGGGRFSMRGFATVDGRPLPPFPANFRIAIGKGGKAASVRLAGTAVDFERRALYIHDRQANRIVCAALR